MEALVYEDSPLADYLDCREPAGSAHSEPASSPPSFAPKGYASLCKHLRRVQQNAIGLAKAGDEKILEHLRYLIVASQLLDGRPRPRPVKVEAPASLVEHYTLTGAFITATLSFVVVWALSQTRSRSYSASEWTRYCLFIVICAGSLAVVVVVGQRSYARYVRQSTMNTLSSLLEECHDFDGAFSPAIKLVQEVEVIARGYELSNPLPPVTRLENETPELRCLQLREILANTVTSTTRHFVDAHSRVLALSSQKDLHQYYEIYDIRLQEYSHAPSFPISPTERYLSLRDLRLAYSKLVLARKVLLCALLALPSERRGMDIQQWLAVMVRLQILRTQLTEATKSIRKVFEEEESKTWGRSPAIDSEPDCERDHHSSTVRKPLLSHGGQQTQAQKRRLDGLASGIRGLNAKMHLFRQEADATAAVNEDPSALCSVLSKQFDLIGADIKSLLSEWEQGKRTMLLNVDTLNRYSRSSSGIRSPISPSPSLGGLTMIDDGPAEALRALTGEDSAQKLSDYGVSDEEVFEAVALPRKRQSLMLSREERIAKLQEDRRKRATMHENADRTTNMLRELEMVIKHRPRSQTTSRILSA